MRTKRKRTAPTNRRSCASRTKISLVAVVPPHDCLIAPYSLEDLSSAIQKEFCNTIPPAADFCTWLHHFRKVPNYGSHGTLFDQFVGAAEQRERNGEAERLGGLKVALRVVRTSRDSRSRKAALVGEV